MSMNHDPELDDILQDDELVRLAGLLKATRRAEPPLDDAFRSSLRRQLMQRAWGMGEVRTPWWQRFAGQPALAWAGAALGILLIGSVVVFTANQPPGTNVLTVTSPMADAHAVQLQQPILVSFNQPMNHAATEAAVQITPATYVTFSWQDSKTLAVHPTGGTLAPNTQYQVTIGPSAKTLSGQPLPRPATITFVTRPPATPPPTPRPTPTTSPSSQLTGEHRLAALPSSPVLRAAVVSRLEHRLLRGRQRRPRIGERRRRRCEDAGAGRRFVSGHHSDRRPSCIHPRRQDRGDDACRPVDQPTSPPRLRSAR